MSSTKPLHVIPRSIVRLVNGSMAYPRERVGQTITLENGQRYRVFREVVVKKNPPQPTGGVFRVWFYTAATPRQTMRLSLLTKLFFFGMPGFRGKMWLINDETGEFGGIYQFDTVADAQAYGESFAMGLSERRSRPGMFSTEYYAKDGESSLYRAQTTPIKIP